MTILGISHPYSLNTAACIIQDGKIIAFAEEERFIRYKHAPRIAAHKATQYCLKKAGIKIKDVDYIAVGYDDWYKCILPNLTSGQTLKFAYHKIRRSVRWLRLLRWKQPFNFKDPRVINVNHHLAHAASTYYLSGFKEANIISLDGAGESESGILAYAKGTEIKVLHRVSNQDSWGGLYEDLTGKLGFKKHSQEGKTMGLASYGVVNEKGLPFINWQAKPIPKINYKHKIKFLNKLQKRDRYAEITQAHKDLAANLQYTLEKAGLKMVEYLYQQKHIKNFCLAGGVALNCAMNGKLLQSQYVDNIFIQPASSDAGTALGAAIKVYVDKTGKLPEKFEHVYWGPEFDNLEIEKTIKECKVAKWKKSENIFKEAAKKLAEDKIVGWFQGRMEVGPRALGNRSILANPSSQDMKDKVNKNVKKREPWRPFAPSILEEDASQYVKNYYPSPFMILAFDANPVKEQEIIAASHVDHTVRLQSVSQKTNPEYWKLINEFKKITGVPAVLNTSFNIAGEPIVCTPRDALRTFFASGMDCLVLGDYLIEK